MLRKLLLEKIGKKIMLVQLLAKKIKIQILYKAKKPNNIKNLKFINKFQEKLTEKDEHLNH